MSEPTRPRAKAFSTAWSDSGRRRCAPSRWRRRFANLRRAVPSAGRPSTGISRSISATMRASGMHRRTIRGREVVRQYSVLKRHRREQVYNIAGNHDASQHGHPANEGKETNWWFRKWCDPVGEHTETSGVDPNKRPYPIDGTWERYTFKVGNIRFLMMGDRNDLPYPVGRRTTGGASPAGAVTPETFAWWTSHVESAGKDDIIITGAHHMLRETTVGSGDYEGVSRNPDGTFRSGRYHGPDGAPEGASYLYFLGDKPKAQAFENYLAAHPGAIDLWVGGHTHTHPDDVLNGRSHVERKWGVNFVNCAQLSKFHSY